ncbi:hypothetical protein R1flu_000890 [Riccia fluitans]|uniref:ABC transporter domain-containing protein n=1 Tax=Riccia fluitans TaxID=41844 RepID=A0ABD1Y1Q8_9MARC
MARDSEEDGRVSTAYAWGGERSVVVDIPDEQAETTTSTATVMATMSRGDRHNQSTSKRNFWVPFPPGPLNYSEERVMRLTASQIAMEPSPDRVKMYEIKVQNLFYRLPCRGSTKFSSIVSKVQRCCGCVSSEDASQGVKAKSDRYILRNINFEAKPRELLAIAGPSGAGKSTLLEVLAGKVKPSSPPGCVLVNGQVVNVHQFQRLSGYVMQDDALFPHLTVKETLLYSARLRLPAATPYADKVARVQTVLEELGLTHVADTRIGNESLRGVSGGERRRVSIGIDVIHNPAVLFLDEPTSGLDSAAAAMIVEVLRAMADVHSRCIILSIHQPSIRILELMDSVLLLSDGMVVHHGSLELLELRLEAAGHQIPPQINVLEYAIDAINSKEADAVKAKHVNGVKQPKLQDFLFEAELDEDQSSVIAWTDSLKDYHNQFGRPEWEKKDREECSTVTYANSSIQEILILAQRFFRNIARPKELFTARTAQSLLSGICLGTLYLRLGKDHALVGASERIGFFGFTLSFLLTSTTEGLPIFLGERHIVMRESSRGAYRVSSYVLSSVAVFAPFLLIMGLVFSIPSYWLIYLSPSTSAFLFFCLVLWLVLMLSNSFVSFFAALSSNYIMGSTLISAFMGASFLFSGFFISKDRIPWYWIYVHYLSLFKYPLEALVINEYDTRLETCFGPTDPSTGLCFTGRYILEQAGIHHLNKWVDVGIMVLFIVVYRFFAYCIICYKISRRRR